MKLRPLFILALVFVATPLFSQNLTIYKSEKSVDETTAMIVKVINDLNLIFFETVDHKVIAAERGIEISATNSILFEDSELTTKLIQCQQTVALDLPLEILVWEENEDVYIGYIDPKFMTKRFLIQDCDDTIEALTRTMVKVTMDAMRQL